MTIRAEKVRILRQQIHPANCHCRRCKPDSLAARLADILPDAPTAIGCLAIAIIAVAVNFYSFS